MYAFLKNITARIFLVLFVSLAVSACTSSSPKLVEFTPMVTPDMPAPKQYINGSLYQQHENHEGGLLSNIFSDVIPHRVGDMLTVILSESTSATKNAKTSVDKDDEISLTDPILFGNPVTINGAAILNKSLDIERGFEGEGSSEQSNTLSGQITATIVDVLPNGNLVIKGEKWFSLNQGEEYIRIAGIVRPQDISSDNTVLSSRIADAKIAYSGEGFIHDSNTQGWLSQFFSSKWWPF